MTKRLCEWSCYHVLETNLWASADRILNKWTITKNVPHYDAISRSLLFQSFESTKSQKICVILIYFLITYTHTQRKRCYCSNQSLPYYSLHHKSMCVTERVNLISFVLYDKRQKKTTYLIFQTMKSTLERGLITNASPRSVLLYLIMRTFIQAPNDSGVGNDLSASIKNLQIQTDLFCSGETLISPYEEST